MAFRRWRRNRPFWGGFFLILSGLMLVASGNLQPANIQIHLGVTGFLSYIVPAFMILCGALTWASPNQRMLYGILGVIAALFSLISVNLGGFLLGMIFGVVGGGLAVAWVPVKHATAFVPTQREPDSDDGDDAATLEGPAAGTDQPSSAADADTTSEVPVGTHAIPNDGANVDAPGDESGTEDKQGGRFPRPRHATPDRDGDSDEVSRTANAPIHARRIPRTAFVVVAALLCTGATGWATLRNPAPAAAATCTPPSLTEILKSAQSAKTTKKARSAKRNTTTTTNGDARLASAGGGAPGDSGLIGGLLGDLGQILTGGGQPVSGGASASPSATSSPTPTTSPSSTPATSPSPSKSPTGSPSPGTSPSPSKTPRTSRTPSPTATTATPTPSTSCAIVAKHLAAAGNQVTVEETPSIQTASLLTMSGLSYDGNVALPTKSGTITVMQFSMDSSTSTPFQLVVTTRGNVMKINSSKLTVSHNVKFYTTEIKGNALGVLPVDYTPANPPPVTPPVLFFTDVTIGLVDVQCDSLTASNLTIS
jgi:hypothetical protein